MTVFSLTLENIPGNYKIPGVGKKRMFKEFSRALEENFKIPGILGAV